MFCIYDNPSTMRRELWRDGDLGVAITYEALTYAKDFRSAREFDLSIMSARRWKAGTLIGDAGAMPSGVGP